MMQKSYKQDSVSQERKEVMLNFFNEYSKQFVLKDISTIDGPNNDNRVQMIPNFTMMDISPVFESIYEKKS